MQTVTTLPILQTVSDATTHYIGLQPAISGRTTAEYVNRNLSFNPASNTLNIGVNVRFLPNAVSGLAIADSGITAQKIAPLTRLIEQAKIIPGPTGGNVNIDLLEATVYYLTGFPVANLTFNLRASSSRRLDDLLSPGQSITRTFLNTNGTTGYKAVALTIDGNAVTPKFLACKLTVAGSANCIEAWTYTVIKTGSAAFTVLTNLTRFF